MDSILQKLDKYKLNNNSFISLYVQIANALENLLKEEQFKNGTKLPSEESLVKHYKVSRPTINRAFELLIKKSLVYRKKGKGTFILSKKIQLPLLQEDISFGESLKKAKVNFYTELLESKIILANEIVANWLNIKKGTEVIYIKRLRYLDNVPFLLINSYLPKDLFSGLENEDFTKYSLLSILEKKYSTSIEKSKRYMKIIKASEKDSFHLNITVGDPLLHLEGVVFSSKNREIEYFDIKLRGDIISFYTTLYVNRRNILP